MTEERERFQVLANGAIYDHDVKRIVANPGGGTTAITQATSTDMLKLRAQRKLEAQEFAQHGMARIARSSNALDAWSDINEGQARLAVDISKGQTSTKAAEFVGRAAGFLVDRRHNDDNTRTINAQFNFGDDILSKLAEIFRPEEVDE